MAQIKLKISQKSSSDTVSETKAKINAYLKTGKQLKKEGKLTQAIEQYQQALELNPKGLRILNHLAVIYESVKELDKAIHYRQQIVKLQPDDSEAFRQLMALYSKVISKKNNIDEVMKTYEEILKETPFNQAEIVHEYLGQTLLKVSTRQDQLQRVLTVFKELIETQPNHPWLHYHLGITLTKQERFEEAISCYEKAIQLKSDFWQALVKLGELLNRFGHRDQAFEYGIKALQINPNLRIQHYSYINQHSTEEWNGLKQTLEANLAQADHLKPPQYYRFVQQLGQQGEFASAIDYCQKLIHRQLQKSKPEFVNQHWDNGRLQDPSFLIIGVAKCGTSALYQYLAQHPQVLPAVVKEPQYLRTVRPKLKRVENEQNWSLLVPEREFYWAHFPPRVKGEQWITGEASTSNWDPNIEKIVFNWCPQIKLIAVLRNPIKRAISLYNFSIEHRKASLDQTLTSELEFLEQITNFDQALDNYSIHHRDHLGRGLYVYYLKRWMKLFPREQLLILSNEDLAQNPAGVMKQTFDFLGLPEYEEINYTPRNVGHYPKDIDPDLLSRLQEFYRPHNQRLEEFLGRKFNWD